MLANKVVLHFLDKNLLKGTTSDFFPNRPSFHLETPDGEIKEIAVDKLKAIFFVKDLEGNKEHKKRYQDSITGGGRKIQIQFADGETIVGFTQGYSADRPGFFVVPADLQGNNERIYVNRAACSSVEFMK